MAAFEFLSDLPHRAWHPQVAAGLQSEGLLFIGKGTPPIEVAVAASARTQTREDLLSAWKARRGSRAAPVLLVVLNQGEVTLCGATGEKPPIYPKIEKGLAERLCREILDLPDRHAALQFLNQALLSLGTPIPGLNNEGLVALHELIHGVPNHSTWVAAGSKSKRVRGYSGKDLLKGLGYKIEKLDNLTMILRDGRQRTALAVMLLDSESPEAGTERFNSLSPVSYALSKADEENLLWVVMVQGCRLRLYSTSVDIGVGRRGRTETFIECQVPLLRDKHLSYLWLLYSAEALAPDGSLFKVLSESHRFAVNLATRLRERIYDEVVPLLSKGVCAAMKITDFSPKGLGKIYDMVLTTLFRLLFVAYAEDRDLLPYRYNDAYRRRSLKQKAQELADCIARKQPISTGDSHWKEIVLLWEAVSKGNSEWGIPQYNGGLFSDDPTLSPAGSALAKLSVRNDTFEPALRALLVIDTDEGVPGPVDFRTLGVREFGTIYEVLLESELARAETDLKRNKKGIYEVAKAGDIADIRQGEIYLHNRSGKRKVTGTYYTKQFAVDHLLEHALVPALSKHYERLSLLDETDAGEAFFDFRVADIAMGSGHFLVAAIDRIEKGMADYLSTHNLPIVRKEMDDLRRAAHHGLGDLAESTNIEDCQLLRRLIARRCIYGVDINPLSVQLARLSVWIHTFVPGLPMSMLDHRLVRGNSLVGIGTIDEISEKFEEATGTLFEVNAEDLLGKAAAPLKRLGKINDATIQELKAARQAVTDVRESVRTSKELCDLIAARPISQSREVTGFPLEHWEDAVGEGMWTQAVRIAQNDLAGLDSLHFPILFPEVFLRDHSGFDVILGNPPWEEVTVEEDQFWKRYSSGLGSLSTGAMEKRKKSLRAEKPNLYTLYHEEREIKERMRKALAGGSYPGIGSGDPDLYKAFCWRFWKLASPTRGHIGVVLPHSVQNAKGSSAFRQSVFPQSSSVQVVMLRNNSEWVFDGVSSGWPINLFSIVRGAPKGGTIHLQGPYSSQRDFEAGIRQPAIAIDHAQVMAWTGTASLPSFPSQFSLDVFLRLRRAPRLDLNEPETWRARPYRELDATNDKPLMILDSTHSEKQHWPVYKGESFDLWNPDRGIYYAYADPERITRKLQEKRQRAHRNRRSPFSEFSWEHIADVSTLPCFSPRVAFRDVSGSVGARTIYATLLPPNVFAANTAPFFLWPRGDEKDQAFLLGILSSTPLDWFARLFVDLHASFFFVNSFPIPRPARTDAKWKRIVRLAGQLACPDDRFACWAQTVDVKCGPVTNDDKTDMANEIDALASHLYGLDEKQIVYIFETYHENHNYRNRLDAVLRHYRAWIGRT